MLQPTSRGLRPAATAQKLGMGLSTLYAKVKQDPNFPRPIKTGGRATIFLEPELDAWIASRAALSRS